MIAQIEILVKTKFYGEGTGHDWYHIDRVRRTALLIGRAEGADLELVELGALLHDIDDHKFNGHDLEAGPLKAREIVFACGGDAALADKVSAIVSEVTYRGAEVATPISSIESASVQDADRLDAMGAIGIARAFAYGGSKGRLLHSPERPPRQHESFEEYVADEGATTNHFYEKLLLLKDRMQTATGRKLAVDRHAFMEIFLNQFFGEWG